MARCCCSSQDVTLTDLRRILHQELAPCASLLKVTPTLLRLTHALGHQCGPGQGPWRATVFRRMEPTTDVHCARFHAGPHPELADDQSGGSDTVDGFHAGSARVSAAAGAGAVVLSGVRVTALDSSMLDCKRTCACGLAVQTAQEWSEVIRSLDLCLRMTVRSPVMPPSIPHPLHGKCACHDHLLNHGVPRCGGRVIVHAVDMQLCQLTHEQRSALSAAGAGHSQPPPRRAPGRGYAPHGVPVLLGV